MQNQSNCAWLATLEWQLLYLVPRLMQYFVFKQDGEGEKEDHESKPENESSAPKADGTTAAE